MATARVSKRYAAALMAVTEEQKRPALLAKDILLLQETISQSRELQRFLHSPVISKEKKKIILGEIFGGKIGKVTALFLSTIVEKRRENLLPEILTHYFRLRDQSMGIMRVEVQTASDFSSKQEKELIRQLEGMTKKKIVVTYSLDKAIKGGFIIRMEDTVLDGSLRRQLEKLHHQLLDGTISNN